MKRWAEAELKEVGTSEEVPPAPPSAASVNMWKIPRVQFQNPDSLSQLSYQCKAKSLNEWVQPSFHHLQWLNTSAVEVQRPLPVMAQSEHLSLGLICVAVMLLTDGWHRREESIFLCLSGSLMLPAGSSSSVLFSKTLEGSSGNPVAR